MINLAALISASIEQKELDYLSRLNHGLLDDYEIEAVGWLMAYQEKYGAVPSKAAIAESPVKSLFTPKSVYVSDPLQAVFEGATDWLIQRHVRREMVAIDEIETQAGRFPVEQFRRLGEFTASISTSKTSSMATIDRDALYSAEAFEASLTLGLPMMDEALGGIGPGDVVLTVARPGVGKSLIACHMAIRWAQAGKRVLFASYEMLPRQITQRLDAILGGFNPNWFRQPLMAAQLAAKRSNVEFFMADMIARGGDVIFTQHTDSSVGALIGAISDNKPDVIIADGMYLINDGNGIGGWETTKAVSNQIKQTALKFGVPIFATTQLKRGAKDGGFTLEDIAYADAIGQDADTVLGIWQDVGSPHLGMQIVKSRFGARGFETKIAHDWDTMVLNEEAPTVSKITFGGSSS